jgi:hypothetical protein
LPFFSTPISILTAWVQSEPPIGCFMLLQTAARCSGHCIGNMFCICMNLVTNAHRFQTQFIGDWCIFMQIVM